MRRTPAIGASEEIEGLYASERDRLWHALLAYTGDPEASRDAVAEAFAQAIGRWSELRDPKAWVWAVAFRLVKREAHRSARLFALPTDFDQGVVQEAPRDELVQLLSSLKRLPRRQRAVVILHDYADLPDSQIAAILGIKPATVRVHLARGRNRLQTEWGDLDE
jgi:RNA polymerase sigma-70 factor, ECF subfamily